MNPMRLAFHRIRERTKRRLSNSGKRICFAHVPKCGGTSIRDGLYEIYNPVERLLVPTAGIGLRASGRVAEVLGRPLGEIREVVLAYELASSRSRLAVGHVYCRPGLVTAFSDDWNFVTILRDPVQRFISEYVYNTLKTSDWAKNDLPIREYLKSPKAHAAATSFARYFSDFSANVDADPREYVDEAVANLKKFAVVGILEDLQAFQNLFKSRIGADLHIAKANESPSGSMKAAFSQDEDMIARVRLLCEADLMIYERIHAYLCGR